MARRVVRGLCLRFNFFFHSFWDELLLYHLDKFLDKWFKQNVEFQAPRCVRNSLWSLIEKIADCNPASGSRLVYFYVVRVLPMASTLPFVGELFAESNVSHDVTEFFDLYLDCAGHRTFANLIMKYACSSTCTVLKYCIMER